MDDIRTILKPDWGVEPWIEEGWERLTVDEKNEVRQRLDKMFALGLPFEIKHEKILYTYAFAMLAQLEVLAMQIPLKCEEHLSCPELKELMHAQLIDEVTHSLAFSKIVYMLCSPYATPPAYNEDIEQFCNFFCHERCPKTAVVLMNLVGESWIEEVFKSMAPHAPRVFETILADEERHVSEAVLYREMGLPAPEILKEKLEKLEEQLLTNLFFQKNHTTALVTLIGVEETIDLLKRLNKKHTLHLSHIGLTPGDAWQTFMKCGKDNLLPIRLYTAKMQEVPISPLRKLMMAQWSEPTDPTIHAEFSIDVTCVDFFNNASARTGLTILVMQAISQFLSENKAFRTFLSYQKLYQSSEAYVSLGVKLPGCQHHLGNMVFENCHLIPHSELMIRVTQNLQNMVFCYKKRQALEEQYPYLLEELDREFARERANIYTMPTPGVPFVGLSNIGPAGFSHISAALLSHETMRFTLGQVDKKMVWNQAAGVFDARDLLPVSVCVDHRVIDATRESPGLLREIFPKVFARMQEDMAAPAVHPKTPALSASMDRLGELLDTNVELAHKSLSTMQTLWCDFLGPAEQLVMFQ